MLQRDRLWRQFAEDDVQRGNHRERDRHGDGVCGRFGDERGKKRERRLNHRCERGLADPPEADARHRDAELRRGDVRIGIAHGAAHGAGAAVALGDQLVDARLANRDDREFRRHEKSVGKHERQHAGQTPQDLHQRPRIG